MSNNEGPEMLRRHFLPLLLAPRVDYRDYSRVLPDFLGGLARDAYQRRSRAIAQLTTRAAIEERQKWVRSTFWKMVGGEPERTALNTRVTGGFDRPAYRVERLIYESRPGMHIPANLYIPKLGQPRYPSVLFQMGHSLNGKAYPMYQYCCQGLARLGFVVLAFDPMGQGERTYYPRPDGSNLTRLPSADDEHTVPGKQLILAGLTSTQLQTWDAVRSLDVLAAHPLVDPKRIASTGNSGGGTLTMLLAAVDDRLACASVACGNTENVACESFNSPGSTDDAEQNFLHSGPHGFDRWDTMYPMAPKPLQVLVSAKDFFGTYSPRYMEDGRAEFARLQSVYRVFGREKNLEWWESPLPHGLSYDLRMEIYRWFRLHLQGISEPLGQEPPVEAEKDETLYASRTGNVVRDFGGLTPQRLAQQHAERKKSRERPAIPELLRLGKPLGRVEKKGETESRVARVEAVEIASEPGVYLPAWVFHPRNVAVRGTLAVLDSSGRNTQWNEDSLCQRLAARGLTVWAVDVRGIGDLRPEFPRQSPNHARWHQDDEAYAWASLILGRPLLGQRVTDLLAAAAAIQGPKLLAARGALAVPAAIFAAAAGADWERVYVNGGPVSYRGLLQAEDAGPSSNLIFDLLGHTDLPELAPGRIVRGDTWDQAALGRFAGVE